MRCYLHRVLLVSLVSAAACGPPRPQLSPQAIAAAHDSETVRTKADVDRFLRSYDLSVVPPRPALEGTAPDTNDAALYYAHGMDVFERDPTEAADSFAWATRLEPSFAQAYYNRWLALRQRRDTRQLADGTMRVGGEPTDSQRVRIDSLLVTAFALNPFVETADGDGAYPFGEWLDDTRLGRRDFQRGRYESAIKLWGRVLAKDPAALEVRVWRARAMFSLQRYADAAQELMVALDAVRRAERDSARVFVRVRKEALSYAIGMLQAQRGDLDGAREAYEQAVADNLGFYMAHARLAGLAILQHDTTTALVEYETATGICGDDAALRFLYGYALYRARRSDDAERQLRDALRLAPDYAAPYAWLGRVFDARGDARQAQTAYAAYLARASRRAPDLAWVRRRVAGERIDEPTAALPRAISPELRPPTAIVSR